MPSLPEPDKGGRVIEWFKVSSGFYRDTALLRAGEAAEVLFVRALGYCMEHETGGRVEAEVLPYLVPTRAQPRANRLVSEGLWDVVPGGFQVRSWDKWQSHGDALAERKRADRERQKRRRERLTSRDTDPDGPGDGHVTLSRDMSRDVTPPEKSREEKRTDTPNGVSAPRKRGTRLDPSWQPSQEEINFALQLGLNPGHVAAKFRDYWHAKTRDATKNDWTATWRNWCRSEAERRQPQSRPSTTDQRVQAGLDLVAKYAAEDGTPHTHLRALPGRSA